MQSCYDEENSYGEDPSCIDYDLSSDPVAYFDGQVSLFAEVQKNLLDTAVLPTQSYQLYGHAVDMILSSLVPEIGFNAASYLGGRNNSYLHKYEDQNDQKRKASEPIPAATQRLALDCDPKTKDCFRPTKPTRFSLRAAAAPCAVSTWMTSSGACEPCSCRKF